jgi:cyanophycinase-like exopeptidase
MCAEVKRGHCTRPLLSSPAFYLSSNCNTNAFNPDIVAMVEEADAIYYSGGQSGRLQSCLYGRFSTNGIDVQDGEMTPVLAALQAKTIVGGSSAGAMNQPTSEILVTGSSVESYSALSAGSVFQRNAGNAMVQSEELIDTHFSERGRQGRLMIIAMQTGQRFAFGADEDSAYFWKPDGTHEAVGESIREGIKAGVVVYQDVTGNSSSQSGLMHYLTSGDTINTNTGEIFFSADKTPCSETSVPRAVNNIFDRPGFPYRAVSLEMSTAPSGSTLSNFHGSNPVVEVEFSKTDSTAAMCGPSGQSFSNLEVSQFAQARFARINTQEPELPMDFMWEIDN